MRSPRGSATGSFPAWTRPRRRRVRPRDEGPQRLQVPPIPGIGPGELEAAREFPETLLVHEETERLLPELPLPDIRVTVEFRSEVAHRIVQVERADPTESDALVDRPEERLVAVPRPEVVARGERVTCVDTDPEAVRMGRAFHHFGELLEPIPDDRPRARRILQDREHVRGVRVLEAPVQARRNHLEGGRKSGSRRPRPPCRAPGRARCSPRSRRGHRGTSLPRRRNRLNTDELADVRVGGDEHHEWRWAPSSIPPGTRPRAFAPSRPDRKASSGSRLAHTT